MKPPSPQKFDKTAVPARARGKKPAKRQLKRVKPGGAPDSYKLCDAVREEICRLIRLGNSRDDSARLAGIHRHTMRVWRNRGEQEESGPYRKFFEELELAELLWKSEALQKLQRDKDSKWVWLLLKARYPAEFRERTEVELAGPGGMPIHPNPCTVEVKMDGPEGGWDKWWEQFVPEDQREAVFGKRQGNGNS
jgi:hypothetical protein